MRNALFGLAMALILMSSPAFAQNVNGFHVQFVDEFGSPVNMTTGASLYIYAAGTTTQLTVYKNREMTQTATQPITDNSTNTPLDYTNGYMQFYVKARSWKINVTDGTYTRTIDNCNEKTNRIAWPSYGMPTSGTSLGQNDDFDFAFAGFIFDGDTAGRVDLIPDADGGIFGIGDTTAQTDVYWYAGTTDWIFLDEGNANASFVDVDITLDDDASLFFGTGGDLSLRSVSNALTLGQVVSGTGTFLVGVDGKGIDTTFYGETASSFMKWDQDGATNGALLFDAASLALGDGDKILLGDTLGTGDFSISDESDVLAFRQIVADTGTVAWGVDNAGIDQTWYGETTGAYMKWDATGADQLQLVGADSSGTLFAITGSDTSGNSDTMTIAHSGTGDALQITASTATAVGLNVVAAASQTTSLAKFDGATGSWLGANNVGMVNLTNDGALAHVGSSLLFINNTGVPQNDSRGSSLRIVDTGNAAAGTAGYAVYVSATDATVEAALIDDGDLRVDEDVIVGGNVLNPATAGTKVMSGCPITIEFRPTTAETLTWAVPDGFDLVVTDAWGYKIAANGTHANDEVTIQNNDGSAAAVFTKEELGAVNDTIRFQFDGLDDTQNEIEDTSSLDVLAAEGASVDCVIVVTGYLKTAD